MLRSQVDGASRFAPTDSAIPISINWPLSRRRIEPNGAVDTYRLGRSLRKKGFDVDDLAVELPAIEADMNRLLTGWIASGARIELVVSGPRLTDLREWVCTLPEGTQRIPCGGTHLRSLAEVEAVSVELVYDQSIGELVMTTQVRR